MPGPAAVRSAATVVVLRDTAAVDAAAVEVLLLRRHARAGFAADAWVFPGGVVEAADRRLPADRWSGLDSAAVAERFAASADEVLGFYVAAVRETFEESGLLLAARDDGSPVDATAPSVRGQREAMASRDAAEGADFGAWLERERLVLDFGLLTYLSRWVTPTVEPRRYDTCFFLARAPSAQVADADRVETTERRWLDPATALDEHHAGRLRLIYPTLRTLEWLAAHATVAAAVAAAAAQPSVRSVQPHIELDADGRPVRVLHPDDPDFPAHLYERSA